MAESEFVGPGQKAQTGSASGVLKAAAVAVQPPEPPVRTDSEAGELPDGYLARELADAEALLSYASEIGIEIAEDVRNAVLKARAAQGSSMTPELAAGLLAALANVARQVRPVTARSLRACADPRQARIVVHLYTWVAAVLCAILLPFSVATFVSSAISDSIHKDVETANALALTLAERERVIRGALDSASAGTANAANAPVSANDMLKELQQFAIAIRALNSHARELSLFAPSSAMTPPGKLAHDQQLDADEKNNKFELPVPLSDLKAQADEALAKIKLYQNVRYRAVSAQETASVWSGAVATCILPVLYAALGACAYLLRLFEEQIKNRTFIGDGHRARFLIAGIGGLVIGLFTNFNMTQGGSLSPLALAFLVGYAVDVFFSFLEGLLRAFGRSAPAAPAAPTEKQA
ncbi:MAG TPA: hypothetical protein VFK05_38205 [Polyangiaceae bacterium]|nr:hypothetical protein [Polyangiaceae bacterium]